MQTRSFEQVLGALKTTSRVNKALAVSSAAPRNRYYAIKEALINTVHAVHIPWRLVVPSTLATINQELGSYRTVFTTNYDLLNYWAVQHRPDAITDLFQGTEPRFDLSLTATDKTRLLYLHGGLHLVRNQDGTARKLMSTEGTLLGSFAINNTIKTLDDVPLFVTEGPTQDKLKNHSQLGLPVVLLRPVTEPWRWAVHLRARPWRAGQSHHSCIAPGEAKDSGDLDLPAQQGVHPASEAALHEGVRGDGRGAAVFLIRRRMHLVVPS